MLPCCFRLVYIAVGNGTFRSCVSFLIPLFKLFRRWIKTTFLESNSKEFQVSHDARVSKLSQFLKGTCDERNSTTGESNPSDQFLTVIQYQWIAGGSDINWHQVPPDSSSSWFFERKISWSGPNSERGGQPKFITKISWKDFKSTKSFRLVLTMKVNKKKKASNENLTWEMLLVIGRRKLKDIKGKEKWWNS